MLSLASFLFNSFLAFLGLLKYNHQIEWYHKNIYYSTPKEYRKLFYLLKSNNVAHYGVFRWRAKYVKCNPEAGESGRMVIESLMINPNKTSFLSRNFERKIKLHELMHMKNLNDSVEMFKKYLQKSCFMTNEKFRKKIKSLLLSIKYKDLILDFETNHGRL